MSAPLVSFTAWGEPAPSGSKTIGRNRHGGAWVRPASGRQKPWQEAVAQAAGIAMRERPPLEGPLRLDVLFFRPRPKSHFRARGGLSAEGERFPLSPTSSPDTTKLVRAVEDAVQGIVVRNDAHIARTRAAQVWGEARAMVEVHAA